MRFLDRTPISCRLMSDTFIRHLMVRWPFEKPSAGTAHSQAPAVGPASRTFASNRAVTCDMGDQLIYGTFRRHPSCAPHPVLGDSLTVEPRTLTPLVLVRIQVPQPFSTRISITSALLGARQNSRDTSAG
jgi:hypothetical protein